MTSILLIISLCYLWFSFREMRASLIDVYHQAQANKLSGTINAFFETVLSCPRCLAFWLGLIVTLHVVPAALASMGMDMWDRIRHKLF